MNVKSLRQFKLSSGEDIIAEVLEWPDDDNVDVLVRNAYRIISVESNMTFYYTFKPWMILQGDPEMFMTININHIVGEAAPALNVIDHYQRAIKTSIEQLENQEVSNEDTVQDYVEHLERLRNVIRSMADTHSEMPTDSDGNVIKFPNKYKLH